MRRLGRDRTSPEGRLLAYEPSTRRWLAVAVGAGLLAATLVVVGGYVLSVVVAGVFGDGRSLTEVAPLLLALLLLAAVRALLLFGAEVAAQRAANRLTGALRRDLTTRLFALGPIYTSRERSGELSSVIVNGLEAIDAWAASYQPARLLAALVPVLVLGVVCALDPPTALVLLVTGPFLVLLLALIGGRARQLSRRRFLELRWLSAFFLDVLGGIATLKMFGRSEEQVETMRSISRRYGETTMEVLRTAFQTSLVLEWGAAVAVALVAVEVSLRLMAGAMPFDRALAVLVICPEFFLPIRQLAIRYHAGSAGRAVAERVFGILDAAGSDRRRAQDPAAVPVPARAPGPAASAGLMRRPPPELRSIRFDGVTYTYPGRAQAVVRELGLVIPAGRSLAIVGETGAGKSTIVNLLLRFVEPDEGTIRVGDEPLPAIGLADWRRAVAWVPQAPHLFHGSVADNIRLGRPDAAIEDVVRVARAAHAADFIDALPDGYATPVGEGGLRLSGGERQRIAIARALLVDAPLLILDEPTAHLDPAAEAAIAETIARLTPRRTVVVVTHRPRLARAADRVVELRDGRVVERRLTTLPTGDGGPVASPRPPRVATAETGA